MPARGLCSVRNKIYCDVAILLDAATHFTELVDYKLLTPEPNLELLTMDVLPGEEKGGIDMGRVFLYKCANRCKSFLGCQLTD